MMFAHFENINEVLRIKTESSSTHTKEDKMDETKRKSRNLSEKKRRDKFNELLNELNSLVSTNDQKLDKSTILKKAVNNLQLYHEYVALSKKYEISEEWKPPFITNEEYTYLMLQAVNGSIFIFSSSGRILYTSTGFAAILGYLLEEILKLNIYDLISLNDRSFLENIFFSTLGNSCNLNKSIYTPVQFLCQFLKKSAKINDTVFEPVEFIGYVKEAQNMHNVLQHQDKIMECSKPLIFVGLIRLLNPHIYNEVILQDHLKKEFTSHHNFEWKFLFLDERAPMIIGYSPFEVLGTSGYDYYHVDDLDNIIAHHKSLIAHNEGVSGYYRFLTKGHQWIWLQTKSYINRKFGNSRIEFVTCTHTVVNPINAETNNKTESNLPLDSEQFYSSSNTNCNIITSPPSWHSTTSVSGSTSNEEDSNKYSGLSQLYGDNYTDTDNTSLSSNISDQNNFHKKRKIYRKSKMSKPSVDYNYNSDTSSGCAYSLSENIASNFSSNNISPLIFDDMMNAETIEMNSLKLEDTLTKKCKELQQIISDRTKELKIVSEQLSIVRHINQQNNINKEDEIFSLNNIANEDLLLLQEFSSNISNDPYILDKIPNEFTLENN